MPTETNSINAATTGIVVNTGTGFTATTTTNHNLLVGAASNAITNVAPSATSGVPVISQGAAADPAFGTVVVAGGGTGATTLTAHSLLLGQGTSAITALGAATNGQIPIGSTGSDPVLAAITAGSGITVTNGAGSITIASSGATSGNMVLLSTVNASSSATVDFANLITSTYDVYVVEFYDVVPGTNNTSLYFRVGTGATPTYDSGSNYYRAGFQNASNTGTVSANNGESETQMNIGPGNNVSTGDSINGYIKCYSLNSTSVRKKFNINISWFDSTSHLQAITGSTLWNTAGTAVSSLRFLFSSGNVSSGTFKLYGIVK